MRKLIFMAAIAFGVLQMQFAQGQMEDKMNQDANLEVAIVAGGCFWCMEPPFERIEGVQSVESGYTGGQKPKPTYQEVAQGQTTHLEAVKITYDPQKVSYDQILDVFWVNIDPTQADGQFADRGNQYRTAIFTLNQEQKNIAEASKKKLADSGKFKKPLVTEIREATAFYPAEEYHQDYYKKNPDHYKMYRYGSGRGPFLERTWGQKDKGQKSKGGFFNSFKGSKNKGS